MGSFTWKRQTRSTTTKLTNQSAIMGVDICHKNDRKVRRTEPRSEDIYLRLLVKLYRFLARRTDSKFNRIILRRLFMSTINRPPMSLARICRNMKQDGNQDKIVVVVGTVTNDLRIFSVPKLTVSSDIHSSSSLGILSGQGVERPRFESLV